MNIIITGATKGIGRAIAIKFAQNGFNIAACARSEADLQQLEVDLKTINPSILIHTMSCDVSKKDMVMEFASFCNAKFKTVDVLVNNAGVFLPGNIYNEPEGTLETLINTNLFSAYNLTRQIVPVMLQQKSGHIFNICSVASINAYDAGGSYAISKFALYGFSKNLRHELKKDNIRVTAVLPGATLTDSWKGTTLPNTRFIDVDDVAALTFQAWSVSDRTVVEEILIRPMEGDI
jgi:short-subunit dehydrogenase